MLPVMQVGRARPGAPPEHDVLHPVGGGLGQARPTNNIGIHGESPLRVKVSVSWTSSPAGPILTLHDFPVGVSPSSINPPPIGGGRVSPRRVLVCRSNERAAAGDRRCCFVQAWAEALGPGSIVEGAMNSASIYRP
ncbi:MAG: hypothetical protein FJ404_12245 [Verrucomicrobia bacterium]|nr:hypothetical protein [Verrucomicrobiota bacterium]